MAVRSTTATETPTAVAGMRAGTWYTVQNQSSDSTLYLAGASSAPARGDPAFVQAPFAGGQVKANPGDSVFIWTDRGTAKVVYDEAQ